MSDPIINQAAQKAAEQASQQGAEQASQQGGDATKAQPEVDAGDQARFEKALQGGETSGTQAVDPSANDAARKAPESKEISPEVQKREEAPTLGEAILEGVEKMKHSHDVRAESIEKQLQATEGKEMSVKDCIKLQFEMMQLALEQETTGKIADKSSQGVQTLFKNQ